MHSLLALLDAMRPGLLLIGVGLGLHWLLGRYYDRVPGRTWAIAAALLALLLGEVLFLGATLGPFDHLLDWVPWQGVGELQEIEANGNPLQWDVLEELWPWLLVTRRQWLDFELPLWNPHAGFGAPLLGNPQAFVQHPFLWLTLPLAEYQALPFVAALRLLVTFLFTFLFARRSGLAEAAATLSATIFAMSGYLQHFLLWPHANAVASAMVSAYALSSFVERRTRARFVLLVIGLYMLLTSGHPETILHASVFLGAVLVWFGLPRCGRRPGFRNFLGVAGAGLIALLLAAPALWSAAEYLPQTNRYAEMQARNEVLRTLDYGEYVERRPQIPLSQRLVPLAAPNAYGSNRRGAYWGLVNSSEANPGFAGAASLFLALLAVVTLGSARGEGARRDRFSLILGCATLLVAISPAFLEMFWVRLPLLDGSPMQHRRALWLFALAVALLAGSAVQRMVCDRVVLSGRIRALIAVASTMLAAAIAAAYGWAWDPIVAATASVDLSALRWSWLAVQVGCILAAATVCALATRGGRRRHAEWLLLAIVIVELSTFHKPLNPAMDRGLFFPETEVTRWLQEYQAARPGSRFLGHHSALPPQIASAYGLFDPRSTGPSLPREADFLLDPLRIESRSVLLRAAPDHALFDLFAIHQTLGHQDLRYRRGVLREGDTRIWAQRDALDLLFLPAASEALGIDDRDRILEHEDFLSLSFVESSDKSEISRSQTHRARGRSLRLESFGAHRLVALVEADELAGVENETMLLASSIYQDGHWQVLADGVEAPLVRTNGVFVGAWLPAQTQVIECLYRPSYLPWMVLAMTCGLVGWAIFVLPSRYFSL